MAGIDFNITGDDNLAELAKELREFVPKRLPRIIAREVIPPLERVMDRMIDDRLRVYPPPRGNNRFIWSRDPVKQARARRWFFANYPNGYTRTGALGRAWRGEITYESNTLTTRISNPLKATSYVYGAEQYDFVQVIGHEQTGWLNAGQTAPDILLDIAIQLDKDTETAIDAELERL